ncbi:lipopolysaccharide assembly protein LapA domain-containing protein [Methylobacterium thuringiense]|uniref:DUF1049 domain-containing protein n=1 Tax=Methylobacterium thuringiense TaxID=1003091 RepID=A0ABQ4TI89_9HYPH|nr:lipopolysaccharide assembly protein LapA domain-containing protein [Methylobacterium thuringiense]GJE54507.1 hypothetical protein EKPJFOCH_0984 [Methylobacterium thuringiense]
MIRFLKALILLPVALVVLLLAVANRNAVTLSFDPFSPEPAFSIVLPLYAIVFAAVAVGILVGGIGAWLGQGKTRASARHHRREREKLERETAQIRTFGPDAGSPAYGGGRAALPAPR